METSALPRRIGLWSAIAIVIGSVIGSGIFRSPAGIADRLPGPLAMMSVWVIGGIFALCGALTMAELASAIPRTGGIYQYLKEAWGRRTGFLFGWTELVIIRAAAYGAISTTFAEYLVRVLGWDPAIAPYDQWVHYIAAAAIALTATFNIVGVRLGALVMNLTTIAKFGGLMFIIIVAFTLGLPSGGAGNFIPMAPAGSFAMGAFGLALVSALWAYDGWADLSFVGGEVKDPQRTLPRALIGGTLAVMAIYLLANLAYLSVLSIEEMRVSKLVAADVAFRLLGRPGEAFVSIVVILSTFGALNGALLTTPRIFFALADDKLFFKQVAYVHPTFKTPYVAIGMAALLGIFFVMIRTFEQLADTFVTAVLPFYALGVGAVFMLRRRPDYAPTFKVPGYPVVPALFVLATIYLLANALIDPTTRWQTAIVLGVILLGIPVYHLTVGREAPKAG
jgi:amino acid transporter